MHQNFFKAKKRNFYVMKASEKPILRFFEGSDKIFKIPIYQRNYEWTEKQCGKLIEDIIFSRSSNVEYYFIGSIVYINNGKKEGSDEYLVIDGQQRLTTISLILLAIIDLIEDEELKEKIKETYLINKWAKNDNERIKLKPIKEDYGAFKKLLNNEELNTESKITKNFLFIKNRLKDFDKNGLKEFYETLNKLFVVDIDLEKGKDDPQLIFESINSTGLGLEQSDLVRNFILMKQENQEELYEKYWSLIEKNTNHQVSRFVRDYLTLRNRLIPKGENVYEDFKKFVLKRDPYKEEIEDLLIDLKRFSEYYENLINCKSENVRIKNLLKNINDLGISVSYPFLLELLDDLENEIIDENILENVLNYLEIFILRRIICEVPTNALNKIFMTLGRDIKNHKRYKENYFEVFKYLLNNKQQSQRLPKDEEFGEKILQKEIYNMQGKYKNYFFSKLESYEKRNIINIEEASIEHIMPKTLTNSWKNELGEDWERIYEKYLNTLGNLTLIDKGDNSVIKNNSFKDKKEFIIEKSNYTLNNYFKDENLISWSKGDIEKRASKLRNRALEIWEYQESSFKPNKKENFIFNFEDIVDYSELKGKRIGSYKFLESEKKVNSWIEFLMEICRELYGKSPALFVSLIETQEIKGSNRKYFSKSKDDLRRGLEIVEDVFVEGNFSVYNILRVIDLLFEKYEIQKNSLELYLDEDT